MKVLTVYQSSVIKFFILIVLFNIKNTNATNCGLYSSKAELHPGTYSYSRIIELPGSSGGTTTNYYTVYCSKGTFSSTGIYSNSCPPTNIGYYADECGQAEQKICPIGYVCPSEHMETPLPCLLSENEYQDNTGATKCKSIPKGDECSNAEETNDGEVVCTGISPCRGGCICGNTKLSVFSDTHCCQEGTGSYYCQDRYDTTKRKLEADCVDLYIPILSKRVTPTKTNYLEREVGIYVWDSDKRDWYLTDKVETIEYIYNNSQFWNIYDVFLTYCDQNSIGDRFNCEDVYITPNYNTPHDLSYYFGESGQIQPLPILPGTFRGNILCDKSYVNPDEDGTTTCSPSSGTATLEHIKAGYYMNVLANGTKKLSECEEGFVCIPNHNPFFCPEGTWSNKRTSFFHECYTCGPEYECKDGEKIHHPLCSKNEYRDGYTCVQCPENHVCDGWDKYSCRETINSESPICSNDRYISFLKEGLLPRIQHSLNQTVQERYTMSYRHKENGIHEKYGVFPPVYWFIPDVVKRY